MRMHYKTEMKYLNAVAEYLTEMGYDVEAPSSKHRDLLDVWGTLNGRKCFQEIYVTMWPCDGGVNGVWHQGEHDVEVFLNEFNELDTNGMTVVLDGLKPLRKIKRRAV